MKPTTRKEFDFSSILNDIERSSLQRLAGDLTTINALKKLFLFGVYYNGTLKGGEEPNPLLNFALNIDPRNEISNDALGAILRAKSEGIVTVELAFKELDKFKPIVEQPKNTSNPGK